MEQKFIGKEIEGSKNDNLEKLRKIFPNVIKDGQVDFEELKNELGEFEEISSEKYDFDWVGKQKSKQEAMSAISGITLKYYPEESKDADKTENLYIEGDNLQILKLLRNNYANKIKMIYIDPPYNTGSDLIYNDKFKNDSKDTENKIGVITDGTKNIAINKDQYYKNQKDSSNYHSNWLNLMYPRLKISWELLTEDGVIFISIDDNELANLKRLCDCIYGESNFVGCFTRATGTTTGQDANKIGSSLDYCLVYAKSEEFSLTGIDLDENDLKRFTEVDEKGAYSILQLRKTGNADRKEDRPNMFYPIKAPDGTDVYPFGPTNYLSRWRVAKNTYDDLVKDNMIVWKENGTEDVIVDGYKRSKWVPYVKYYSEGRTKQVSNLLQNIDGNKKASIEIKELFGTKGIFDNPKPTEFIRLLLQIANLSKGDIVLDFFSGSATTAHSVFKYNVMDNKEIKFIMVQLPEECDVKTEAYKNGYNNICEIGKERIRRAGDKIKQETNADIDYGFKVFKLDETNINWEKEEYKKNIDNYILNLDSEREKNLQDFVDGAKDIDIVYELLLRYYGMPLSAKIAKVDSIGNRTYSINDVIIICLEDEITNEIIDKLSKIDFAKLYLRDSSFKGANSLEIKENLMIRLNLQKEYNNEKSYRVEFI